MLNPLLPAQPPWPADATSPWSTGAELTAFERSAKQVADEERRLRQTLEARLRDYAQLILEFASSFLAQELDTQLRQDPQFLARALPADWRHLLGQAHQRLGGSRTWGNAPPDLAALDQALGAQGRLQAEVTQLQADLRLARAVLVEARSVPAAPVLPVSAPVPAASAVSATAPEAAPAAPTVSAAVPVAAPVEVAPPNPPRGPAVARPGSAPPSQAPPPRGLQDWQLPRLPAEPPARFSQDLGNWEREGLALALLGCTGFSMRQALGEAMAAQLGDVQANAGSIRRVLGHLSERGFWQEAKVTVAGVHKPTVAQASAATLLIVRLTDQGRAVLRACGLEAVWSEWDILHAQHGGEAQLTHTGLICAVTYQARRRGYATAVCPPVAGPAEPDLLLRQGAQDLYVEVEGASGAVERRLIKWRNQYTLQGQVALVAITPALQISLVAEAQAAGAAHGVATDLQTLVDTQAARGPFWTTTW